MSAARAVRHVSREIDDQLLEDIRAEEREKILARIRAAKENAIPKETRDWLLGFEAGVQHVADAVLGK